MRYIARVRFPSSLLVLFLTLLAPALAGAQSGPQVTGTILDASGAPLANASVTAGGALVTTSGDGTFVLTAPPGPITIQATAPGFVPARLTLTDPSAPVRLTLQPAPLEDTVLVTASRGAARLATAGSTTTVSSAELLNSGAGSLDDALRSTPGFSLFRRSSSRVSNPTTQGVTLRGVSGSGASRTLVLADGVPLNDPFGSWIYWNRVPQAAVERVEIVRGATGDLYGADALGGVVQVLTFAPGHTRLRFTADGGSFDTRRVSAYGSTQRNGWFGEGSGEMVRTDGVVVVGAESRGAIDVRADSDYQSGFFGGGYNAGAWHVGLRASLYDEDRGNGTPLQVNTTNWKQLSAVGGGSVAGGAWLLRGSGGTQDYFQTFTAPLTVAGVPRAAERLTTEQTTPTDFSQFSGQWTRTLGAVAALVGGEARRTESTVEELRYSVANVQSGPFFAGGRETIGAVFGRISVTPVDALTVVVGARGDFWRSNPRDATGMEHSSNFFSPRVSAAWRFSDAVSVHGAAYRSHRTPSLNELHRGFTVGQIVTNPNPQLDPETLTGVEAGVMYSRRAWTVRVTGFTNQLENAITNVTIGTNLRQRQNTDTVRASGIEMEADLRLHSRWSIGLLAVGTRSRFDQTPAQPGLEGNDVPQVAPYQFGGSVTYVDPIGFTGSVQARAFGSQFDDDQNLLELERYGVVDLSASQRLGHGINVFVAVENLFDKDYDVGRTPQRTIGWPRSARAGVRVFLP
jgi:outer membrane receptor protein involved in Fe transport